MTELENKRILENYYKAAYALSTIGTIKTVPDELLKLTIQASQATTKILDYINTNRTDN